MIKLLLALLFINSAYSATSEECSNQLITLGSGVEKSEIDGSCYDLFKDQAKENSKYTSIENKIEVIGHKNSLYIKNLESNQLLVTAGIYSTLEDVIAVDYNKEKSEVLILEKNTSEVKVFSSFIAGNVAPYRVIRTEELIGAVDILSIGDEIYVLNEKDSSILVYNRLANYFGREGYQKLDLIKVYESIPSTAQSIELVDEKINVLDVDKKLVSVVNFKN